MCSTGSIARSVKIRTFTNVSTKALIVGKKGNEAEAAKLRADAIENYSRGLCFEGLEEPHYVLFEFSEAAPALRQERR